MAEVMKTAPAEMGTESAVEDRKVLGPQRCGIETIRFGFTRDDGSVIGTGQRVFDGIEQVDMLDHPPDFFVRVSQMFQGWPDCLIDDLQHAAAGQKFVFY